MKAISIAAIGLGVFCLIAAPVGHFIGANLFKVDPIKYVHLASACFLLAIAVTCHCRACGSNNGQK